MEFDIYAVTGQKKMIEAFRCEPGDKAITFHNETGDILWWVNPNAVAFINYKIEDKPKIELVN